MHPNSLTEPLAQPEEGARLGWEGHAPANSRLLGRTSLLTLAGLGAGALAGVLCLPIGKEIVRPPLASVLPAEIFECTDVHPPPPGTPLPQIIAAEGKGLAVDDTTWNGCPGKVPMHWPVYTGSEVKNLRLFKADSALGDQAWQSLEAFLQRSGGGVLVGSSISCDRQADRTDWENVKILIKRLGRPRVLGLAIGNEVEVALIDPKTPKSCKDMIIPYLIDEFSRRSRELDNLDGDSFATLPLTVVTTAGVMTATNSSIAETMSFTPLWENVFSRIHGDVSPDRFTFTFNVYPYFDACPPALLPPHPPGTFLDCDTWRRLTSCFDDKQLCYTPHVLAGARWAIRKFQAKHAPAGQPASRMWVGELGWSSPSAPSLVACKEGVPCEHWSDLKVLEEYYRGYASWDLTLADGLEPPELAFYFTIRDSFDGGRAEHFGLCGSAPTSEVDLGASCANTTSKL